MITYFDTSALVKLIVTEDHSEVARLAFEQSTLRAISSIGYVESRAALSRALRMEILTADSLISAKNSFELLWEAFFTVNVTDEIVRYAGDLAERHSLRGYDAVHLASASILRNEINENISFAAWDHSLVKAAINENYELIYSQD